MFGKGLSSLLLDIDWDHSMDCFSFLC
uniref:Uncharacterized protein n=1 Tax=Rhizophora mucronata TaxID=61149 RepID=A0A2P2R4Y7_RHIMU